MAEKEREVDASSLPPLSEQEQLAGCSGPHSVARLPPARVGSPPGPGHPQHLHIVTSGARGSPEPPGFPPANPRAQGRRAGIARATSCHRPSSPHRCAWRGLGSQGRGPRREAAPPPPRSFVCPNPRSPACERPDRAPRPPARRPPRRGARSAPARPDQTLGTHSGAAAAPASWGPSGRLAPTPARSPTPCRAIARPAGSQPCRAEDTNPAGETRAPAAAPLPGGGLPRPWAPGARARPGAGPPGAPSHWAAPGGGGASRRDTPPHAAGAAPASREAQLDARQRRVRPLGTRARARGGFGAGG